MQCIHTNIAHSTLEVFVPKSTDIWMIRRKTLYYTEASEIHNGIAYSHCDVLTGKSINTAGVLSILTDLPYKC